MQPSRGTQPDRILPFEQLTDRYEAWFPAHTHAYLSELAALAELIGRPRRPIEVGIGTGRFAEPLGITLGLEPARAAGARAQARGLQVIRGVGEALPLADGAVDLVLVVTTICFFEDERAAVAEIGRVLEPGGRLVLGFVDRATPLGQAYLEKQGTNPFYRPARFFSTDEVLDLLAGEGFQVRATRQTLFGDPTALSAPSPVRDGHGEGGFVALEAQGPGRA